MKTRPAKRAVVISGFLFDIIGEGMLKVQIHLEL